MGDLLFLLVTISFMGMPVALINPRLAFMSGQTRGKAVLRWLLIFIASLLVAGICGAIFGEGSSWLSPVIVAILCLFIFVAWPAFAVADAMRKRSPIAVEIKESNLAPKTQPYSLDYRPKLPGKKQAEKTRRSSYREPPPVTSQSTPNRSKNLRFTYEDRFGNITDRELSWWRDEGDRIIGGDLTRDGEERTFIKHNIINFHNSTPELSEAIIEQQPAADQMEICFTGFDSGRKKLLEGVANGAGMKVRTKVTKNLDFLVCGDEGAGPSKVKQAKNQSVNILDEEGFFRLIQTGEI